MRLIALNELNRPEIDLSRPPMTSNDWLLSANRNQLCSRVPIIMIYQRNEVFPPDSVIKKPNQIAFSHCCMVVIRFHFLLQSSINHLVWFFDNGNSVPSGGNSWCLFSSQHTDTRRPPMSYLDRKGGGWGRGGLGQGIIIKIFWPNELNDLWSKTICRYT